MRIRNQQEAASAGGGWPPRCNFVLRPPWTSTGPVGNPGPHHPQRSSMLWPPAIQLHLIWLRKRMMKLWTLRIEQDPARLPLCRVSLKTCLYRLLGHELYIILVWPHFWIEVQYGPPPTLRSRDQPVLPLNSSEWWQYWLIHSPQNYSIPPILATLSQYSPLWVNTRHFA